MRVEAFPGFVQHQQIGADQERLGEPDLLGRALGEVGQAGVAVFGELEAVDPAVDVGVTAAQGGHPAQILLGGERLLGGEPLGHPADDRWPVPDGAPGRPQHSGRELEQRGLAGAVAAEDDDRLAGADDRVDGRQGPAGPAGVPEPDLIETHGSEPSIKEAPGVSPEGCS
jgi:hypothetical protein